MKKSCRRFILRGYIEQFGDSEWRGIILTLNLPASGRSVEEVEGKLRQLSEDYLRDALKKGDFDEMFPRRAPASYYLRYLVIRILTILNHPTDSWHVFSTSDSLQALNA